MWQVFAFVFGQKCPYNLSTTIIYVFWCVPCAKKASKVIRTVKPKINQKPNDKLPNAWEKGIHCSCFEKMFECIENANYITVHKFPSKIRNKPTSSQPTSRREIERDGEKEKHTKH